MTEQPRAADPELTGPAPGGSATSGDGVGSTTADQAAGRAGATPDAKAPGSRDDEQVKETRQVKVTEQAEVTEVTKQAEGTKQVKVTAQTEQTEETAQAEVTGQAGPAAQAEQTEQAAQAGAATAEGTAQAEPAEQTEAATPAEATEEETTPMGPVADDGIAEVLAAEAPSGPEGAVVDEPAEPAEPVPAEGAGPFAAELEALRAELDERTRDLQRVSAEYANYRKRVDRDRGLMAEQATAAVLVALLPILDDLDRAREHGDLVGPFGTVAEQLIAALGKFGLTPFGEPGDRFDPTRHEAVAHRTSADVTESTCVDIMRRGYLLGDRLLRAALVGVADPE